MNRLLHPRPCRWRNVASACEECTYGLTCPTCGRRSAGSGLDVAHGLISGPERSNIFILTRERAVREELQAEILSVAEANGLPVMDLVYPSQTQANCNRSRGDLIRLDAE